MNRQRVYDLSDCSDYRQTLLAEPPRCVRATVVLLFALAAGAVLWAAFTRADLVVRSPGRVRPMLRAEHAVDAAAEESRISPPKGGRVVEIHVREGDEVREGDLLMRLDTRKLDNDITRQRQSMQTTEHEVDELDELGALVTRRFEAARSKAEAELAQAKERVRRAKERRSSRIRRSEARLELAAGELRRLEKLAARRIVSEAEVEHARTRFRETELELDEARLEVEEGPLFVLDRALLLAEKDYAVEQAELAARRQRKRAELEASRLELANLELELRQMELRAPSDGRVTWVGVGVGEVVRSGQLVLKTAEQLGFRMDVAVTSSQVGHLYVGMPARIQLDAYDDQKYGTVTGRVVFISPDSEVPRGDTVPGPPSYAVKIALDAGKPGRAQLRGRIRLGMTGIAELVTGRESILWLFVRSWRPSLSLGASLRSPDPGRPSPRGR